MGCFILGKHTRHLFTSLILLLTLFMLINPRETVTAASFGFNLWYTTVLPALFPFFVVAELLVSLRFVHLLGLWLEPVMRPLFNLPGSSSLVVVMGFTSGFPVGALLTRQLYEQNLLNDSEAERLVSFTNNCSPLFIIGAVGVGMFGSPTIGYWLAAGHYLSNLIVGLGLKYFRSGRTVLTAINTSPIFPDPSDMDSVGKILGRSIHHAINNILAVGGFIVVFAVLTRMLSAWGVIDFIAARLVNIFAGLNLTYPLAYGLCMGFFEITLGSQATAASTVTNFLPSLLVVSIILAFSGLSIIAQVMSILDGIPVRFWFYIRARIIQILLSTTIVCFIYKILGPQSINTMNINAPPVYKVIYAFDAWTVSLICMLIGIVMIFLMLATAWVYSALTNYPRSRF